MNIHHLLNKIFQTGTGDPAHTIGYDSVAKRWKKWAWPSGGESWTRVTLGTAFTSTTQSTYEEVTGLQIALVPGIYDMRGVFTLSNASGANATAFELAINDSLNPQAVYFGSVIENGPAFNYIAQDENTNNEPVLSGSVGINNGTTQRVYWYGGLIVEVGFTQTVKLATYGAGALVTLNAGSFIEYIRRDA